ncbi:MAG: ABC transporter substrate-binding protein [Deltaproteobacteria bacterium]|nr:ABC transporter substrate-binding protein [Deltaproteobacteria bacterium]MBW2121980.1 ABC transporter substrate-binding protein [Deltaproteobacteria bacterium]
MNDRSSHRLVVFFILPLLLSLSWAAAWASPTTYAIADTTGDWGYPSPYRRYPRGPGYVRMSFIFDTLTWKNRAGKVIPALAKHWEYLDHENAYVFDLDRGAKWHDGLPFTAEDVVFTFQYAKKHPMPWIDPKLLQGAIAIDPHRVKVILGRRYAPFLINVAGTMPILPRHIWQEVSTPRRFGAKKALVGTGPFKLLDYNRAQGSYLYEANPLYYGGKPSVSRIKFTKIAREMIGPALRQGLVDAGSIPPDLAKDMRRLGYHVIRAPYGWHLKLVMNHREPPLDQKEFRQALAYAIDRKALVEITQRGHAMVGHPGFVPPDSPWCNPHVKRYPFDPARARALLQNLGYKLTGGRIIRDGVPLRLEILSQPRFKEVGLFLKEELESLGFEVDIRTLESKTVDSRILHWQFRLALSGHGGLYDPSFLKRAILDEGFNSVRYHRNEELKRLVMAQLEEMDPEQRRRIVFRIQELYAEDLPNLPLYYPNWYWAHNGRLSLFYTRNGIAIGIPLPLNKLAFIDRK